MHQVNRNVIKMILQVLKYRQSPNPTIPQPSQVFFAVPPPTLLYFLLSFLLILVLSLVPFPPSQKLAPPLLRLITLSPHPAQSSGL